MPPPLTRHPFPLALLQVWLVLGLAAVAIPPPAAASSGSTVAFWPMDESPGSKTMVDASGSGRHGSIGNDVFVGTQVGDATTYRWAFTSPDKSPYQPERIVSVPHHSSLNPGSQDYAISMRYRTNQPFGNILQKGQGGAAGGYWKIENPGGYLTCVFRAPVAGGGWNRREVVSPTRLNDNEFHIIRCERADSRLILTVDGVVVDTSGGFAGSINNNNNLSIGGKTNCNNQTISCDYYTGNIDWIRIESGGDASAPSPSGGGASAPAPLSGSTIFADDFSTGDFQAWDKVRNLDVDHDSGQPSAPSARAVTSNDSAYAMARLPSSVESLCVRTSIRHRSSSGGVNIMQLRQGGGAAIATVYVNSQDKLVLKSNVSGAQRGSSGVPTGSWDTLELCGGIGGSWDLRLNGSTVIDNFGANFGSSPIAQVQIGSSSRESLDISYDDVRVTS